MGLAELTLAELLERIEREGRALQTKLSEVERRKKMVLDLLNGEQPLNLSASSRKASQARTGKATGLTDAVISVVSRLARDRAIASSDVTQELLSQDFKPRGAKFSTSVYCCLTRLAEKGRVSTVNNGGKRLFILKNGNTPKMTPAQS